MEPAKGLLNQIRFLFIHELKLEWKNKYAINGILLYVTGAVFICYMSFNVKKGIIHPITWNALFWIIILFSAVNAIAKSFIGQKEGRNLYYYLLVRPEALILAKMIYNALLLIVLSVLGLIFYSVVMGNPVQDMAMFIAALLLGCIGLACSLTLISGIAAKAGGNMALMSILSFPVILPVILLVIKVSKSAIDGIDRSISYDEMIVLSALNAIIIAVCRMLFPYLWRN